MGIIKRIVAKWRSCFGTPRTVSFEYDPWDSDGRISSWKDLLEGRTIDSLIIKENKTSFNTPEGRVEEAGVIGFVVEGVPVYIRPAAFGDAFGTLEVAMDKSGKFVELPEEEL